MSEYRVKDEHGHTIAALPTHQEAEDYARRLVLSGRSRVWIEHPAQFDHPLPEALPASQWHHSMFTAAQMRAYAAEARRAAMEECAQMLEAQHALRSHLDNHAACYARAIREAMDKP